MQLMMMSLFKSLSSVYFLSFLVLPSVAERVAQLPKPLSDHSATLWNETSVFLAGGCDSVKGNEYFGNAKYGCFSISQEFYRYDISTNHFEKLKDLPSPRYRHSAVVLDGKIWFVGGRNYNDQLISQVDVSRL